MLSEYENNLIQQSASSNSERKSRKTSIFRQIGQTLNGRHKSGLAESALCQHHLSDSHHHNAGQEIRHVSNCPQRAGRDPHPEASSSKMVQIHECNEAEGRV